MPRRRAGRLIDLEVGILSAGLSVQARDDSFYGFSLAKEMAEHAGGGALTAHGTLYKALGRLKDAGLLEATWEDPEIGEGEGRPRRRLYRVTGAGEVALASELAARRQETAAGKAAFA